jgi:hypothetical protein
VKRFSACLSITFILCALAPFVRAQEVTEEPGSRQAEGLNVYLDCNRCDEQYIRTEITFVNYVRDRVDADIHLLITDTNTGSGGREYTLNYIGRGPFLGMEDTFRYTSPDIDTSDERRAGLVRAMKIGLMRYIADTPLSDRISISYEALDGQAETTRTDDPWNYWVFSTGVEAAFEGEESSDFVHFEGDLDADRVTEAWKLRFALDGDYRRSTFELDDTTIVNIRRDGSLSSTIAKSFGSHWSAGGFLFVNTS